MTDLAYGFSFIEKFLTIASWVDKASSDLNCRTPVIEPSMIGTLLRSIGWRPTEKEVQVYQSRLKRSYQETHCELGDVMAFLDMTPNPRSQEQEEERLRQAFNVIDKDGSGFIDKAEMESFLTSHGEPLEQGMVDLVFASYDVNSDGRISLDEFKMVLTDFGADTSAVQRLGDVKGPEDMVRTLRNIFEKFDADGNGFIDKAELVNILSFLGFPLDAVDVDRVYADMIGNVDAEAAGGNADGKVSIGEVATALGGELIDAQGTDHENSSIMTGAQELIVQAAVAEALPDN